MWLPNEIKQVCVVGGGNAAHVLGALLGNAHANGSRVRVALLAPFGNECERLTKATREAGGITLENPDGSTTLGMPHLITTDPREALTGTQIVILPLPTFAVQSMLKLIAPFLEPNTWVGALPAQGGYQWIAGSMLDTSPEGKNIKIFGMDKLPYNCRIVEYGKMVRVFGYKEDLALASIPNDPKLSSTMASTISAVIPKLNLYTVPSFLVLTLATSNQCIHPARMYGMFAEKQTIDRIPLFYDEMDNYSASIVGQVSDEILAIARALEAKATKLGSSLDLSDVMSVAESTLKVYEVEDASSLAKIFATCEGFAGIQTPLKKIETEDGSDLYEVDWAGRYFTEDIPALVVLRGLAQLVEIDVPTMDMLIRWAQKYMPGGYEFLKKDGKLNNDRKKMMYTPQYWGITTLRDLLKFHATTSN